MHPGGRTQGGLLRVPCASKSFNTEGTEFLGGHFVEVFPATEDTETITDIPEKKLLVGIDIGGTKTAVLLSSNPLAAL